MPEAMQTATAAPGASLLFLREEQLRLAQDMLFLAWRDFSGCVDPLLEAEGLGRAHHRALHFIGRSPGLTVGDLLATLSITKQSLARVLTPLVERGYVVAATGRGDRRQRTLRLTEAGVTLERGLFDRQREKLLAAYREAGGPAVEGFRKVLHGLTSRAGQNYLAAAQATPPQKPVM
jgi:DNA-binding MarR family transcriptional regulator